MPIAKRTTENWPNYVLVFFALLTAILSQGQTSRIIQPAIGTPNNYTREDQLLWQNVMTTYASIDAGAADYQNLPQNIKDLIDVLEMGNGPYTPHGVGCSWYCGGEMYKVSSDSFLKEQGGNNYKPENIHDFNLMTAWVPDTTGGVIGKKINFHFKPFSPRVNEIFVYNGYIKNIDLFYANSRVKAFNLYVNGIYYASLAVADTTAEQSFKIDAMQSLDSNKDMVLTFEIAAIYKGKKFSEVAVSEINFSGLDVH